MSIGKSSYCSASVHACSLYRRFTMDEKKGTINPFVPSAPFLYPLKTSENLTVF